MTLYMQSRSFLITNMILDALIVGGGPAGLSAALAFGHVCRGALVFDSRSLQECWNHRHASSVVARRN